ncbi:uncharacterized protein LOC131947910 [Physella acuta]|uniref:uncharacterized protein LOC131947910 n=1 Tax=Physella acuta TaxID=109671 RepID=UPI0027DCD3FF|nr:uncharacterized protein LOC131947910 [Physella acuta]
MNSMKIEITVYDAKCGDAGVYSCKASYDEDQWSKKIQNLTILARVVPLPLSVFPNGQKQYELVNPAGSNVTLTCNVYGPRNVTLQWKLGNRLSNFSSFTPYPVQNHITYAAPVVDSDAPCVKYLHSSTLKFQTENKYNGYMYVCVAKENMRDTIVGNMTIYTNP